MNEQQRAVVQQALDAFAVLKMNDYSGYECTKHETDKIDDAETALRQLLEQPAPVQELAEYDAGLLNDYGGGNVQWWHDYIRYELGCAYEHYKEQLTTPPAQPAVPLTDEQANLLINGRGDEDDDDYVEPTGDGFGLTDEDLVKLVRRVEAHHGIEVKP